MKSPACSPNSDGRSPLLCVGRLHAKHRRRDVPCPVDEDKLNALLQGELPVLVDFWAEWCGPCVMMEGIIKDFAGLHQARVTVAKLDATLHPKSTKKYQVRGLPTLVLFKDCKETARHIGSLSSKELVAFVETHLNTPEQGDKP